jgi:AcrR family transcriptional regulator
VSTYHHGNLRAALIDVAVEQAREGGAPAVVLRDAARRVGVSHNAAYRHFSDREELLGAVAEHGARLLEDRMREGLDAVRTRDRAARARRRLEEVGRAYVHFALAEPGLFVSVFGQAKPPELAGPYLLLNQVLDELVDAGVVPPERRPGADVTCWAAVHGFAMLCLQGPLQALPAPERERELDGLLARITRGL